MSYAHDYHESLPDYVPEAALHSGCAECERRAAEPLLALLNMDVARLRQFFARAIAHNRGELGDSDVDPLEIPVLHAAYRIAVLNQRAGWADLFRSPP